MKTTQSIRSAFAVFAALSTLMPTANAAPFADWFNVSVPNGGTVRIWGEGNNFDAHFRTEDGRTLVFNVDVGRYEYVRKDETTGALVGVGVFLGDEAENAGVLAALPVGDVYDTSDGHSASVVEKARTWDEAMGISAGWQAQKERNEAFRAAVASGDEDGPAFTRETVGNVCGFTLLVDFPLFDSSGNVTSTLATVKGERDRYGRDYMLGLLNGQGWHEDGNVASVRDFYYQMSMGRLVYTNVVTDWILVPRARSYYDTNSDAGACGRLLLRDALTVLKSQPDFNSRYLPMLRAATLDGGTSGSPLALNVLFAGGSASDWSRGLWAHSWVLSSTEYNKCTWTSSSGGSCHFYKYQITALRSSSSSSAPVIGTLCHEDGHMICFFPDYYQYSKMPFQTIAGEGVGEWSLMCSANHLGGGMQPGAVDAYSRYHAGWVEPIDISLNQGWVEVTNSYDCVYRYVNPANSREAFFFENRQKDGIDSGLAHGGLLIWRTKWGGDTTSPNTQPSSLAAKFRGLTTDAVAATNRLDNELSLEQANGSYHLERGLGRSYATDPWYAGNEASATAGIRNSGYSGLWNDNTVACARWSDGSASGLKISQISQCGQVMRFFVGEASAVYLGDALDCTDLSFTTGGDTGWFGQHTTTHDGSDAAQSGSITHGQSSWMETSVMGPGTISFWWNVSSEGGEYDYLEFLVDGVRKGKIGGTTATWASVSFGVEGTGQHTLRWNYRKDASESAGNDCGWVDQVSWTPSGSAPAAPTSVTAQDGVRTDGVTVSWEPSSGATSYSVWRSASNASSSATRIATGIANATHSDSTAEPGTLYYYWVTASNASGTSPFSAADSGYCALSAPGSLSASDGTSSAAVELSWSAVPGATSYSIYRGTSANPTAVLVSGVTATSYSDTSAAANTTYYYRVKAVCALCESGYSPSDTGYRVTPSDITLTASDGTSTAHVAVQWSAVSSAASYTLYRGTSASATSVLASGLSSTSYNDTSASPGTRYYYRVRAVFSNGTTGEFSAADAGYRLLSPPASLSASDGTQSKRVDVSWSSVTGATSYTVYRGTASNPTSVLASGITGTTYADTSAVAGTTYHYRVRAVCSVCQSGYSADDTGYRRLVAATTVTASDGTSTEFITVSWTAISGAEAYNLYRSEASSGTFDLIADGLTVRQYQDVNATPGKRYWYRVRADYGSSLGENSDPDSGYRLLSAPANLQASDGQSTASVEITWTEASGASTYTLYRRRAGASESGYSVLESNIETTSFADTTAVPGYVYQYFVVAFCTLCQSDVSEADTGYIKLSPPTGLEATDGTSTSKVTVSWNSVPGALTYTLYRGTSDAPKTAIATDLTETSYEDTSADASQIYYYRVKANNESRSSDYGVSDAGWRRPSVTAGIVAADGESTAGVAVTWDAVSGANTYNLFRGKVANPTVYANGAMIAEGLSSTSFMDETADPGVLYWYRIQPVNGAGSAGDFSEFDTGFRRISPPPGLAATQGTLTSGVKLTWTETPAGASQYLIARGTSANGTSLIDTSKTKLSYTDSDAAPGVLLYYRVAAAGGVSTSAWSTVVSGHRKLSAPSSMTASDGTSADAVELSWPVSAGATSYRVYRNEAEGATNLVATVATNGLADATAEPGVYYTYRVVAVCALSESDFSKTDVGHRALAAPDCVTASDGTSFSSITVSWTPSPGAVSYTLYRGTSADPTTVWTNNLTETTFTDEWLSISKGTLLTPGTLYWYRVKSVGETGATSLFTGSDSGYVGLQAPQNVIAADGASTANVALSWDAVNGASKYLVARNTDTNEPPAIVKTGLSSPTWSDSSATNGVLYWYRVAAVSSSTACTSAWSAVESGYRMLAAPTGLAASDGTSTESISLSWTAAAGAESYLVFRGDSEFTVDTLVPYAEVSAAQTQYTDAAVDPGAYYWYQVAAASAVCTGACSTANSGYRALCGPENLTATDGTFTDHIDISWSPVDGAATYTLYRGTSATSFSSTPIADGLTGTSYTHVMGTTAPKPGTVYWFRVRATAPSGTVSAYSEPDSGYMTLDIPVLTATAGTSAANVGLAWNAIFGAAAYNLYRAEGTNAAPSELIKAKATGTSFNDTTAVPGVLYSYALEAYNGAITGRCSVAATGWRQVTPPGSVRATDGTSEQDVTVTWAASAGALSYTVLRGDSATTATNVLATGVAELTYADATGVPGTVYHYAVQADGKDFSSAPSATDPGHRLIPAPALSASDGEYTDRIALAWDETPYATSYILYRGTTAEPTTVVATNYTDRTFTDTGVDPGKLYYYRLKAICAAGTASAFGPSDGGYRRLGAPAAPTVTVNGSALKVQWTRVTGATHSRVYRAESPDGEKTALGTWTTSTSYTDSTCTGGVTYWYFVQCAADGTGARPGDIGPGASGVTPPANDAFANAASLAGASGTIRATNNGATVQSYEPQHAGIAPSATVWWFWTAPASGTNVFDTAGSAFNSVLAVYTGTKISALTAVASSAGNGPGGSSRVTFEATAGTKYYIAVGGRTGADTGDIVLSWQSSSGGGDTPAHAPDIGSATFVTVGGQTIFRLSFWGEVGFAYLIQRKENLSDATWTTVQRFVPEHDGQVTADIYPDPTADSAFYRVKVE